LLLARAPLEFFDMSDRELILDAVREMPETASTHEIIEELLLLDEVKSRLAKSDRNEGGVPHEKVAGMLDSWITKSSGTTKRLPS
jgi:hypothetical protein